MAFGERDIDCSIYPGKSLKRNGSGKERRCTLCKNSTKQQQQQQQQWQNLTFKRDV